MSQYPLSKKSSFLLFAMLFASGAATGDYTKSHLSKDDRWNQKLCKTYTPDGYKCVECAYHSYMDKKGICQPVSDYCKTWDEKTGDCTSCFDGYGHPVKGVCSSTPVGSDNGKVVQDDHCAKYGFIDSKKKWSDHWAKDCKKVCRQCDKGYFLTSTYKCIALPPYCIEVTDSGACTKCVKGYELNDKGICCPEIIKKHCDDKSCDHKDCKDKSCKQDYDSCSKKEHDSKKVKQHDSKSKKEDCQSVSKKEHDSKSQKQSCEQKSWKQDSKSKSCEEDSKSKKSYKKDCKEDSKKPVKKDFEKHSKKSDKKDCEEQSKSYKSDKKDCEDQKKPVKKDFEKHSKKSDKKDCEEQSKSKKSEKQSKGSDCQSEKSGSEIVKGVLKIVDKYDDKIIKDFKKTFDDRKSKKQDCLKKSEKKSCEQKSQKSCEQGSKKQKYGK